MSPRDAKYLYQRAEEEIERACRATDERVVAVHYQLGSLYLDRLFGSEHRAYGAEETQ
jgi:hypothetical protein